MKAPAAGPVTPIPPSRARRTDRGEVVAEETAAEAVGTLLAQREWRAGEVKATEVEAAVHGQHWAGFRLDMLPFT